MVPSISQCGTGGCGCATLALAGFRGARSLRSGQACGTRIFSVPDGFAGNEEEGLPTVQGSLSFSSPTRRFLKQDCYKERVVLDSVTLQRSKGPTGKRPLTIPRANPIATIFAVRSCLALFPFGCSRS